MHYTPTQPIKIKVVNPPRRYSPDCILPVCNTEVYATTATADDGSIERRLRWRSYPRGAGSF